MPPCEKCGRVHGPGRHVHRYVKSVRQLIAEILEFVRDVVDELGSGREIGYIARILEEGSGADRQLRVFSETGDLKQVVDYMIAQTESGL